MPDSIITPKEVLQGSLAAVHRIMEATMADVTNETANLHVPGKANPIGSSYAHVVLSEDAFVQGMLRGQPPLSTTHWAGRTGVDQPMPMRGMVQGDLGEWYHSVRVDLTAAREYAQAVYAQSNAFLDQADDTTLARPIDMSMVGMGTMPLAVIFSIFVVGHGNNLLGEISAIKGVHGLRGYPF